MDEPSGSHQAVRALWAAIADRDTHLLRLLESVAQIVWVTDERGNVLGDPPAAIAHLTWSAFTGISQETMRGQGWLAAVHPEDVRHVAQLLQYAILHAAPVHSQFRVRAAAGGWHWMNVHGNPIRDTHGRVYGWIGTCTDITTGKRVEEALRDSQQRLMAALAAGEMSTWIWNLADNTMRWDEAGGRLWGLAPDADVVHDMDSLGKLVNPDDHEAVRRAMAETVATGVAVPSEFRTVRSDGKLQWLSSRGRVELDETARPVRVVGAFVDITKLKLAEESARQAQKIQALGTLAAGIAHDFNNLLLAIEGNARLVLADLPGEHAGVRSLQEIMQVSQRGVDLVRRILAFAAPRPPSGATASLLPAIEETLSLLRPSIPPRVRMVTRFPENSLSCALSSTEVQQIVVNLVNNAVQAIGDAVGEIEIDVESDVVKPGFGQLLIRDTGCGMDEATRQRIFDPFFTTKLAGKGTGLGLAVVHGIVQSCGGSIEVASAVGRGTTFSLSLPLAASAASESAPAAAAPALTGAGQHLLYVDDDENVVFLIEHWFKRQGYRVSGFVDPRQALAAFTADPPGFDVVITDLSMPRMNGFDFVRAAKAVRADVPIVMTSGFVREQDAELARSLGIDHLILKPNTIDALAAALQTLFAGLPKRS